MKKLYMISATLMAFFSSNSGHAQIQFSPYQAITTGSFANVVSLADVNNDGKNDVILGMAAYNDSPNDHKVLLYLQNNNGTLSNPIVYAGATDDIDTIDTADMNNDGRTDVVIGYGDKVGIFFQNILGTLDPLTVISTSGAVYSLKIDDLNNDGLMDIAIATSSNIEIKTNTGAGNFTTALLPFSGSIYNEIHIGDVGGDNKKDIVCMTGFQGFKVFVQNSTGGFNAGIDYPYSFIRGIAIGDLNNDGKMDIAASYARNSPAAKVAIWTQNPVTHALDGPNELSSYDIPESVEIADLNNDGKNEIVTVHGGWQKLTTFSQNVAGNYGAYNSFGLPYASHYEEQGMCVGDINNDGRKDIAIADYNYGLVILYNISTLGWSDNEFAKPVKIYPNPVTDIATITFSNNFVDENTAIEIYNTLGVLASSQKATLEATQYLQTDKLASGMYFVKVRNGENTFSEKIIKR